MRQSARVGSRFAASVYGSSWRHGSMPTRSTRSNARSGQRWTFRRRPSRPVSGRIPIRLAAQAVRRVCAVTYVKSSKPCHLESCKILPHSEIFSFSAARKKGAATRGGSPLRHHRVGPLLRVGRPPWRQKATTNPARARTLPARGPRQWAATSDRRLQRVEGMISLTRTVDLTLR